MECLYDLLSDLALRVEGLQVDMAAFYAGQERSALPNPNLYGGGRMKWVSSFDKRRANGVTIHDPDHVGSLSRTALGDYHSHQGCASGRGCWVALNNVNLSVLSGGAVADNDGTHGTGTDATMAINKTIEAVSTGGGGMVNIPRGYYRIRINPEEAGNSLIRMRSNVDLVFEHGAELVMDSTRAKSYQMLSLKDVHNVRIRRATLRGDRKVHVSSTGEWGMGISLRGVTDVEIIRPVVTNCWGDGIYIASTKRQTYCKNVTIRSPVIDSCRRQGISVISAENLFIEDAVLRNTGGTAPEAGIDLEPNHAHHRLVNINIDKPRTSNNKGGGILCAFGRLDESTLPVSVSVVGHVSNRDKFGASLAGLYRAVAGEIRFIKPVYQLTALGGFISRKWGSPSLAVFVVRPTLTDVNTRRSSDIKNASAFSVYASRGDHVRQPIGNVHIIKPLVRNQNGHRPVHLLNFSNSENRVSRGAVSLIDPIKADTKSYPVNIEGNGGSGRYGTTYISDAYGVLRRNVTATSYFRTTDGTYAKTLTNHSMAKTSNLYLDDLYYYLQDDFSLICKSSKLGRNVWRILANKVNNSLKFYPGGFTSIETSDEGARVKLRPVPDGFLIVYRAGVWHDKF